MLLEDLSVEKAQRQGNSLLRAMKRWLKRLCIAAVGALAIIVVSLDRPSGAKEINPPKDTPDFTQRDADAWINSPPLSLRDQCDKVVLIDFWTFDCWNC